MFWTITLLDDDDDEVEVEVEVEAEESTACCLSKTHIRSISSLLRSSTTSLYTNYTHLYLLYFIHHSWYGR